jgi:ABC-type uncharacterized transport system substrate-binding protein
MITKTLAQFCLLITVLLMTGSAEAQQPKKIPRIGFLATVSPSTISDRVEAFRQGLRELGYVEGKNIVIEWRYEEGKADRLPPPDLAAELVRLKVDVIVTAGALVTRAAKEATSTIPIVMGQDTDPIGNGFVASLARPGGNITGLATLAPEKWKTTRASERNCSQALPRGFPRGIDPAGQRTSVKRDGSRRNDVRGAASIPGRN